MQRFKPIPIRLISGLTVLVWAASSVSLADARHLVDQRLGVVVTLPRDWSIADAGSGFPSAVSADGTVKVVLLGLAPQSGFAVVGPGATASAFAPLVNDVRLSDGGRIVVNGLSAEKFSGTGIAEGKS